jgi:nicotinamide-nucleotide adenylyltransferase
MILEIMSDKMKALFLGRFQPFHCGHFQVVADIAKSAEYVVIAIGSAQLSHSQNNPFTAGERYEMISRSLNAAEIDNYYIVQLEDLNRYSLWVSHVVSHAPVFDVVYAHNPLSIRLFKEGGFEVVKLDLLKPDEYSGSNIRKKIIEGGEWQNLVPRQVAEVIEEIDGVKRLKELV